MHLRAKYGLLILSAALALPAAPLGAQTNPTARVLGTVTSVGAGSVTVKGENGSENTVPLTAQTHYYRTAPGETSLKNATAMQPGELAVGDRVLIRAAADGSAGVLVAIKSSDIAQHRQQEAADWQRRGVAGIVDAVGGDSLTLKGTPPVTLHAGPATVVRRYAADSTSFADTKKAALADIHPGDQVRARGDKTGSDVQAEEIVAGSFRDVSGTVLGTDPGANTLTLTNLATKKPETLHLDAHTQLRKLPPEMAARLAHKSGSNISGATPGAPASEAGAGDHPHGNNAADMLQHASIITLADLHKGDAVMIVASGPGAPQPTAITLIAGVEPLLTASPDAGAGLFSASWNLGGGGAEAGPQQ